MTPAEVLAWANAARILVTIGGATVEMVKSMFRQAGRTEAELNTILDELINDATMRRAVSASIANG